MEKFKIDEAKSESRELYAFIKFLIIISLSIIFFGIIFYMELWFVTNYTIVNWAIYFFIAFIVMYISITLLELKEGANNGN